MCVCHAGSARGMPCGAERQEGKACVLKVSNLTGRYSSEEARRRSREGQRTLPIYVGSTHIPPQPVEQSPKHCSAIVRRFSVFRSLLWDRENSLNNRGNDFDCLELAGFVRTSFLKLGWVLTPLQAWNIDPACEHRNAGGGRDMVLAIRMGDCGGPVN
jgi:hypothetical protein